MVELTKTSENSPVSIQEKKKIRTNHKSRDHPGKSYSDVLFA